MTYRFRVVLANGVFDMLHVGHLLHLEAAAKWGERLVVSVTDDKHVNKGPNRPIYNQRQRALLVKALKCVDDVIIVPGLISALQSVKPDILVKGIDYKEGLDTVHQWYCRMKGIEIRFTDTPKFSATDAINAVIRDREKLAS